MNWKLLLELSKDDSLENLRRNQLVFRIAKEAIQNYINGGEVLEGSTYAEAFMVWDRNRHDYILSAKDTSGDIVVAFPDAEHATILRDGINDYVIQVLFSHTTALLQQCIAIVDGKAKDLERHIAHEYLNETRFGDSKYLENEFKVFVNNKLRSVSDRSAKDVYNHIPVRFNFKGRLKEYFEEWGANTNNLHIINQ